MSCELDLNVALRNELERARQALQGCDQSLEKLVGPTSLPGIGRGRGVVGPNRGAPFSREPVVSYRDITAASPAGPRDRRRLGREDLFSQRLGPPIGRRGKGDLDKVPNVLALASVKNEKATKAREAKLEEIHKKEDGQSRNRNKRMFGALLGTLQKFQTDEEKVKEREEKRARLEKKLEEQQKEEKVKLHREKTELLYLRRRKQQQVKRLEYKMYRLKEHQEWEEAQNKLKKEFIRTRVKPHIFWMPKTLRSRDEQAIEETHARIDDEIAARRRIFESELALEKEMTAGEGKSEVAGGENRGRDGRGGTSEEEEEEEPKREEEEEPKREEEEEPKGEEEEEENKEEKEKENEEEDKGEEKEEEDKPSAPVDKEDTEHEETVGGEEMSEKTVDDVSLPPTNAATANEDHFEPDYED